MNHKKFIKGTFSQQQKILQNEQLTEQFVNECNQQLVQFFDEYINKYEISIWILELFAKFSTICQKCNDIQYKSYQIIKQKAIINSENIGWMFVLYAIFDDDVKQLKERGKDLEATELTQRVFKIILKYWNDQLLRSHTWQFIEKSVVFNSYILYYYFLAAYMVMSEVSSIQLLQRQLFGSNYNFDQLFQQLYCQQITSCIEELSINRELFMQFGEFLAFQNFDQLVELVDKTNNYDIYTPLFYYCECSHLVSIYYEAKKSIKCVDKLIIEIVGLQNKFVQHCDLLNTSRKTPIFNQLYQLSGNNLVFDFLKDNLLLSLLIDLFKKVSGQTFYLIFEQVVQYIQSINLCFISSQYLMAYIIVQYCQVLLCSQNEYFNKGDIQNCTETNKFINKILDSIRQSNSLSVIVQSLLFSFGYYAFYIEDQEERKILDYYEKQFTIGFTGEAFLLINIDILSQLFYGYNMQGICIFNDTIQKELQKQYQNIQEFNKSVFDLEQYSTQQQCISILLTIDHLFLLACNIESDVMQSVIGLLLTIQKNLFLMNETNTEVLIEYAIKLFYAVSEQNRVYCIQLISRLNMNNKNKRATAFCIQYIVQMSNQNTALSANQKMVIIHCINQMSNADLSKVLDKFDDTPINDISQMSFYDIMYYFALLTRIENQSIVEHFFKVINGQYLSQAIQNLDIFEQVLSNLVQAKAQQQCIVRYIITYLKVGDLYVQLDQLRIDFVPLFYVICRIIFKNILIFKLTEQDFDQIVLIFNKDSIGSLNFKQNRYLQTLCQENQHFIHGISLLNSCIVIPSLRKNISIRISSKYNYLRYLDITGLLSRQHDIEILPKLAQLQLIYSFDNINLLLCERTRFYVVMPNEQHCYEALKQEITTGDAVNLIKQFGGKQISKLNINIQALIHVIITNYDVLDRLQMLYQCSVCYKE